MELVQGRLGEQLQAKEYLIRQDKIYTDEGQVTIYYTPPLKKVTSDDAELPLPAMFDELIKSATIMSLEGVKTFEIEQYVNAKVTELIRGRENQVGLNRPALFEI